MNSLQRPLIVNEIEASRDPVNVITEFKKTTRNPIEESDIVLSPLQTAAIGTTPVQEIANPDDQTNSNSKPADENAIEIDEVALTKSETDSDDFVPVVKLASPEENVAAGDNSNPADTSDKELLLMGSVCKKRLLGIILPHHLCLKFNFYI